MSPAPPYPPWLQGFASVRRSQTTHLRVVVRESPYAQNTKPRHWAARQLVQQHKQQLAAGEGGQQQQRQRQEQRDAGRAADGRGSNMFPRLAPKNGPTKLVQPLMMRQRKQRQHPRPVPFDQLATAFRPGADAGAARLAQAVASQ
jgi:hypothetical protein